MALHGQAPPLASVFPDEHALNGQRIGWSSPPPVSSESKTAECALLFCVARAALSEPRGVLAASGVQDRAESALLFCVARPALSGPRGESGVQDRGVRASILCGQASTFGASRTPRGVRASILCGQASTFGASRSPRGVRSPRLCGQASTFGASRSPRGVRSPRPQSPRFCSVWPGQHFRSLAESSRSPESWPAESALPFCVASARFFNDFLPAHRTKFIILN